MANRYFVGAEDALWSKTANWSTSSGGAGGASVPGNSDVAFFDANSPSATLDDARSLSAINCTNYTGAIDSTSPFNRLTLSGTTQTFNNTSCDLFVKIIGNTTTFVGSVSFDKLFLKGTVTFQSGQTVTTNSVRFTDVGLSSARNLKSSVPGTKANFIVLNRVGVLLCTATDIDSSGGLLLYSTGALSNTENWTNTNYEDQEIATYADLQNMPYMTASYHLTADIDCTDEDPFVPFSATPNTGSVGGSYGDSIYFAGNFDGHGHIISNLVIENPDGRFTALFGYVDTYLTNQEQYIFQNLTIENATITGTMFVGAICGYGFHVEFKNCHIKNTEVVGEDSVGLLAGEIYNNNSLPEEVLLSCDSCSASGSISGAEDYIGGLVGVSYGVSFQDCTADVSISVLDGWAVGAIVGGFFFRSSHYGDQRSFIKNCTTTGEIGDGEIYCCGGIGGYVSGDCDVTNCHSSVNITSVDESGAGGLFGDLENSTVIDCSASGNVSSRWMAGGFIGMSDQNIITNCHSSGQVSGQDSIGGFVGLEEYDVIKNCYSTGDVVPDDGASSSIGGFIGIVYNVDIDDITVYNCYSKGNVGSETSTAWAVGGFVGWADSSSSPDFPIIKKCYSEGNVIGTSHTGGFIGTAQRGVIEDCYSTGNVEIIVDGSDYENSGGFVGDLSHEGIANCYSTGNVIGDQYVGGFVGDAGQTVTNCYSVGTVSGESFVGGFAGQVDASDFIVNCSWNSNSADNAIGDLDGSAVETLSEEGLGSDEEDPEEFYKKSHVVYDQNDPDGWDFVTPVWYAWTYKYPLFVPQPVSVGFVLHGKRSGAIERIPGGNDQYKADFVQKLCYHSETHTKEAWDSNGKKFTPSHTFDGEFKNGYDRNPDTMRRLEIYKSGDGSIKGDLTHEHVWDEPRRIEDVYFNVRLSNYMGNYAGRSVPVGRRIRVYLKKESGWDADPVYEVVNNVYGSNKWNHWDVVHTVAGPWDGVLGVKIILFGNSYSFEGDRQQRNRFIFYDVRCNGLYDSYSFRLAKKVLGRMGHWNNAFLTQETAGTWTSPTMKINARTLHFMFWNPSLSSNDSIIFYTRTGETEEECLAAEWSAGLTNPNGTQITSPPNVWIQYKIEFTAVDTRISNPRVFFASGHVVKFTYEKGAIVAETSVNMEYEIGFRNFEDPMKDKFFKKLNITHLAFDSSKADAGIVDIEWETEHSANTFIVDLSKNPRHWESFYHDTAIGREMNLRFLKSDLNPYRLREIKMMYSEYPVVL